MFKKGEKRHLIWSKEEDSILFEHKDKSNEQISQILKRTAGAVRTRKYKLGLVIPVRISIITPTINGCKNWSTEEDKKLIALHQSYSLAQLALIFKRTYGSIKARKGTLGLTSPRNSNWSSEEIKTLKTMYRRNKPMGDIYVKVDRTYPALYNRLHKLKIKRRNK